MNRLLGLDLGSKTLGVSISDPYGMIARVYDTFRFSEDDYNAAIAYLMKIIEKEQISTIVLGYPRHMNGDVGIRGKISEDFKQKILQKKQINVILWDERLSTISVNKAMIDGNMRREKRKQHKDELAAVVILQDYLNKK